MATRTEIRAAVTAYLAATDYDTSNFLIGRDGWVHAKLDADKRPGCNARPFYGVATVADIMAGAAA